jgi:hypothetical protein
MRMGGRIELWFQEAIGFTQKVNSAETGMLRGFAEKIARLRGRRAARTLAALFCNESFPEEKF